MTLYQILKLEANERSLIEIVKYMQAARKEYDQVRAFAHYLNLKSQLNQLEDVEKQAVSFLQTTKVEDVKLLEPIYSTLIDVYYKLSKFDRMYETIISRHKVLDVMEEYLTLYDMIKYKMRIGEEFIDDVYELQKQNIPNQMMIQTNEIIYNHLRENNQYEEAYLQLKVLFSSDLYETYKYEELFILNELKRYEEIKDISERLLEENDDIKVIKWLLMAYMELNIMGKIPIIDAGYTDRFEELDLLDQEIIYNLFISYYEKESNQVSLDHYNSNLKRVKRDLKRLERDVAKKEQEELEEISSTPFIKFEYDNDKPVQYKPTKVLEHMEQIQDWLLYAYQLEFRLPLREFLRQFFIYVDKDLKAKDYIVYTEDSETNLYHYKKDRLYDKHIRLPLLKNTPIEDVLFSYEDFLANNKQLINKVNILNLKNYDDSVKFVYGFPIADVGVLIVHVEEEITDPAIYYDRFKAISTILYSRLAVEMNVDRFKKEIKYYEKLVEHPSLMLRDMNEYQSRFNENAVKLFGLSGNVPLELFIKEISYDKIFAYEQLTKRMFKKAGQSEIISYKFKDKEIVESMYSIDKNGEIHIISFFIDQTNSVKEVKDLYLKATIDEQTGLANKYSFEENLGEYIEHKTTFMLIELDTSLKYIYGTNKMNLYFKEFSLWFKKNVTNATVYRLAHDQVLLVLPYNDIRTVKQTVLEINEKLLNYNISSIPDQPFKFSLGIVRFPVATNNKNVKAIYKYLDISLQIAKRSKDDNHHFFLYKDYEGEVFEQTVIDYLNDAIERRSLALSLTRVVNTIENIVYLYESELILPNIDIEPRYIYNLALKRNRLVELEYYHLDTVTKFLYELSNETGVYVNVLVPVSRNTFLDKNFISHITKLLKKYKIPSEHLLIKVDATFKTMSYESVIKDLQKEGIKVHTTNLEMAMIYPFNAVHMESRYKQQRWYNYLSSSNKILKEENTKLIVRNVRNVDEKDMLRDLGIEYVEGSLYKKVTTEKLIEGIKNKLK